ncbi:MAG: hypothetical protein WCL23_04810 [Candidatus Moraniibacteriota bacterium]
MEKPREKASIAVFPASDIISPILHGASRIERVSDHLIFEPLGLSFAAFKILKYLSCAGPTSPKTMLPFIGGTKSNLSQRFSHLEKSGLVRKLPATGSDRRYVAFGLTPAGSRKLGSIETRAKREGQRLIEHFTKAEIAAHHAFFKKLLSLLSQTDAEGCTGCEMKNKSS